MIDQIVEKLTPKINGAIEIALERHLKLYDSFTALPATMSLQEAATLSGFTVSNLRHYHKKGLIVIKKVGEGRGKLRIEKGEILKLMSKKL